MSMCRSKCELSYNISRSFPSSFHDQCILHDVFSAMRFPVDFAHGFIARFENEWAKINYGKKTIRPPKSAVLLENRTSASNV